MYFYDKCLNQEIIMKKVKSSNISYIGYFESDSLLYICFNETESVYRYKNIPKSLYNKLMEAKSKGSFLSEKIKPFPKKYSYKKLKGGIYAR